MSTYTDAHKKYKQSEKGKKSTARADSKVKIIQFKLNLVETQRAERIENPNKTAKKLFLQYLDGIENET